MPDILDQGQIDALLSAASESAQGRDDAGPAEGGSPPPAGAFRYYDFLRPERASSSSMRALCDAHEAAARGLGAALSAALGSSVDCRLRALDQVSWGEFVMGLANPTCLAVVSARPPVGTAGGSGGEGGGGEGGEGEEPASREAPRNLAIEIDPGVLFPTIERLLGAPEGERGEVPGRPLTAIERRVASAVVEIALGPVAEMISRARPVELELVRLEPNPSIVPLAPPAEMAAVATFEVAFGAVSGALHLAVPFSEWSEVLDALALSSAGLGGARPAGARGAGEREAARAAAALAGVPVRLEATAGPIRMPIRELAKLAAGDSIEMGAARRGEVILTVAGRPKFRATEGVSGGRRALTVTGRVGPVA